MVFFSFAVGVTRGLGGGTFYFSDGGPNLVAGGTFPQIRILMGGWGGCTCGVRRPASPRAHASREQWNPNRPLEARDHPDLPRRSSAPPDERTSKRGGAAGASRVTTMKWLAGQEQICPSSR